MKPMTHLERLLGALYASEAWYAFWLEHKGLYFKTRALIDFDRAMQYTTWHHEAAHGITKGHT